MTNSESKLLTFRDILNDRSQKVTAKDPIGSTENFIKFEQPWPINKEKDDKDKTTPKKQTESDKLKDREAALRKVGNKKQFSTDKYLSVELVSRKDLNEDTVIYTFKHPLKSVDEFNVGIGQHILCAFMLDDGIVERPYAITRPTGSDKDDGTIDILVKTAFPSEKDPGGTISNILSTLKPDRGDEMLVRGPEGPIIYKGNGEFSITIDNSEHKKINLKKVNFISGGTGMTPIYATIRAILEKDTSDAVHVKFLDANLTQKEILLESNLAELSDKHSTRFQITHVLEHPEDDWHGEKGLIDEEKMKKHLFAADDGVVSIVCGPPPMMEAAKKGLGSMGFKENSTFFHY